MTYDETGFACASGCTSRGRHLVDCEHHDDGACSGCLPRLATNGLVCSGCTGRYARAISEAPDLVVHLRASMEPTSAQSEDAKSKPKGKGQGKHTPAPMSLDALDAADRLYAELAAWTRVACDDLDLTMPRLDGWRPDGSEGQVAGLKAGGRNDAPVMADLLLTHAERIFAQAWAPDLISEMHELVRQVDLRWPREERPKYLPTPCGRCDNMSLVRSVPAWADEYATIQCRSCGYIVEPVLYAWHARRILAEKQAELEARVGAA